MVFWQKSRWVNAAGNYWMMVMSERAGRGEIPFDRELTDELAWLDSAYQGDFKGEYCHGYIEFCDAFMRDFEANY